MHLDFIPGAACLALEVAVNPPRVLPHTAQEMLEEPPRSYTHPALFPHQHPQHPLHRCPA